MIPYRGAPLFVSRDGITATPPYRRVRYPEWPLELLQPLRYRFRKHSKLSFSVKTTRPTLQDAHPRPEILRSFRKGRIHSSRTLGSRRPTVLEFRHAPTFSQSRRELLGCSDCVWVLPCKVCKNRRNSEAGCFCAAPSAETSRKVEPLLPTLIRHGPSNALWAHAKQL